MKYAGDIMFRDFTLNGSWGFLLTLRELPTGRFRTLSIK
jgi:hypothetical protein